MTRVRKIYKYNFVYKTTNLINNKIYIGQKSSNDLSLSYLGSGIVFRNSLNKYGRENFKREILEFCTKENLNEREIFWIKELDSMNPEIGYNLCIGGGVTTGYKHKEETLIKIGNSNRGKRHKPKSEESKQKNRESSTGRIHSAESLHKMSIKATGRLHSEESKQKNRDKHLGKVASQETIDLMKSSSAKREKFTCIHCGYIGTKNLIVQRHNDNCKQNPNYIPKEKIVVDYICPHCGAIGHNKGNMYRNHFDRCKSKHSEDK